MAASSRDKDPFVLKYLLTISAATVAETVTFPLDIIKTRLQVNRQTRSSALPPDGMVRTALRLVKKEGFVQLWRGVNPAILRHWIYSGCRMSFYEIIRDYVFKRDRNGRYPLWKAIPTGMIAGAGGQFLASPADRVKIILQVEGTKLSPTYGGTWKTFRTIAMREGVSGLWKGWFPNCQRAALVCLGGEHPPWPFNSDVICYNMAESPNLTTYDTAKQAILRSTSMKDNALTHALASGASGLVSAIMGTPADVMKSRMMSQPYNTHNRGLIYSSTLDCLMSTVRQEGFFALYKGFIPTWSRMAPWSLTFWLVYEEIRVLAGIGTF